ncbi:MAG: DNA-binding protein [Desulfovibrio sp.]|nr:MAG: DNA-binding protein [Desulfovibrio sp.]
MTPPLLLRLPTDADLLKALTDICVENSIERGTVELIGALRKAVTGFYLQDEQRYQAHVFDEPLEILSGLGNVSLKDGAPFVHLHLTLGRGNGECLGGHAMEGCVIFAAEACITPIDGPALVRELDEVTGLPLWKPFS